MNYQFKKVHLVWFSLVAIFFIAVAFYNYREEVRKNSLPPTLEFHLGCESDKIGQNILDLHKDTILIGAYVQFDKLPLDTETQNFLDESGIELVEGSQLFEISPKIIARIPTESVCDLVELESVMNLSIPDNNQKLNEIK